MLRTQGCCASRNATLPAHSRLKLLVRRKAWLTTPPNEATSAWRVARSPATRTMRRTGRQGCCRQARSNASEIGATHRLHQICCHMLREGGAQVKRRLGPLAGGGASAWPLRARPIRPPGQAPRCLPCRAAAPRAQRCCHRPADSSPARRSACGAVPVPIR